MSKKIALVDIDGCFVKSDLNFNDELIKRLKEGGYTEIVFFTQRSKYVQSLNISTFLIIEQ
jgi:hypothetical protein